MDNKDLMSKEDSTPARLENTPESIRKRVVKISGEHPLTLFPLAIGIGSAICGWIINFPSLYLLALFGIIGGPANFVARAFIFGDRLEMKIRRGLRQLAEEEAKMELGLLRDKLENVGEIRGAEQLAEIQRAMQRFRTKLGEEVGPKKPEFEQFLQAAQQAYLAAIKSLKMVVSNALDAKVIDVDECNRRIELLERDPEKNKTELMILRRKVNCLAQADKDSDELQQIVEGSIAALLETTRDISDSTESRQNMDNALRKLSNVAEINREIRERVNRTWKELGSSL